MNATATPSGRRTRRVVEAAQMIRLPSVTNNLIEWSIPTRRLDTVELPEDALATVQSFIDDHRFAKELSEAGLRPRQKLLLSGPSGIGKTSLANAIATELRRPLGNVLTASIVDSHMGKTSRNIAQALETREACVLFLDEFDAIALARGETSNSAGKECNRMVSTLLTAMERLHAGCCLIAATNRPADCDSALDRRFDCHLNLPLPMMEQLVPFAESLAERWQLDISEVDLGSTYATAERAVLNAARDAVIERCKRR